MAQFLYASKEDMDMVTREVDNLKASYRSIDVIARRFNDLWHEQVCQGEQMARMEDDVRTIKHKLYVVEQRLDKIEQILSKLCTHLKLSL